MSNSILKVIHVDDNEHDRKRVSGIFSELPGAVLLGSFDSAESAVEYLQHNEVDMVLLDIELPGKDGLWLAKTLSHSHTHIAFLTAHPEYAVAAFDIFALHYLVKPVTTDQIQAVLQRVRSMKKIIPETQERQIHSFDSFVKRSSYPTRIFLRSLHETLIVELEKVMYFSAKRSCTQFEMADGEKITASKNLKVYADFVASNPNFIRVHRSHVVNKSFIRAITQKGHTPNLVMKDGVSLEVSYFRKNDIMETLEN